MTNQAKTITIIAAIELAERARMAANILASRPAGRRFLEVLRAELAGLSEGQLLLVDFGLVTLMDSSFADEAFGRLVTDGRAGNGLLALTGLNPTSWENLEIALSSRPLREPGVRNCVLPVIGDDGAVQLVGKAENHVRETFELLLSRSTITARELSDTFAIDIAAASTRLKVLYNLGLATRIEDGTSSGRQYIYSWVR